MFKTAPIRFIAGGIALFVMAMCGVKTSTINSETIGFLGIMAFIFGIILWRISKIRM